MLNGEQIGMNFNWNIFFLSSLVQLKSLYLWTIFKIVDAPNSMLMQNGFNIQLLYEENRKLLIVLNNQNWFFVFIIYQNVMLFWCVLLNMHFEMVEHLVCLSSNFSFWQTACLLEHLWLIYILADCWVFMLHVICSCLGGRKRSSFYYDLWNIKYLSKFKWDDLTEEIGI